MIKRESGWYRVCSEHFSWELLKFDAESGLFRVDDGWMDGELLLKLGVVIDPKMVMNLSGEIVYHHKEHDPLYNTSQEG